MRTQCKTKQTQNKTKQNKCKTKLPTQNTNSKATNNVFAFCVHRAPPWSSYIYCFKGSAGPLSFCVGSTELLLGPHIYLFISGSSERSSNTKPKGFCVLYDAIADNAIASSADPSAGPERKNEFCVLRPQLRRRTRVHR